MIDTNLKIFLQNLVSKNSLYTINNLEGLASGFIVPTTNVNPHSQIKLLFIPAQLLLQFSGRFSGLENTYKEELSNKLLGTILYVNEFQNFREAIIKFPLGFLTNSAFTKFLDQYEGVRMTPDCFMYCSLNSSHPLYNYLDVNNKILTRFHLSQNGNLSTRIGKAKRSYQYISVFDRDIEINNYSDHHFTLPYKKKTKELNDAFGNTVDGSVYYKNIDINTDPSAIDPVLSNFLFEVDRTTAMDLRSIPKLELLSFAKIKENVALSQQVLLKLPGLKEDEFIELPTKLKIGRSKVSYVNQDLQSSIISPEDFIFNTKKTFPAFDINNLSESKLYVPVTAGGPVDTVDWDRYLSAFVIYNWIKVAQYGSIKLRIGSVDITLEYLKDKHLFYINGFRINKDEVTEVLTKALCYRTQEDYNMIVSIISNTSLEMHRFIQTGLLFQLNLNKLPEFENSKLTFLKDQRYFDVSFRIIRIKNINYVEVFNKTNPNQQYGELVKIKDSRTLMNLHNTTVNWDTFNIYFGSNTKVLEKAIDLHVDGAEMLKQAIARYVVAFNKSKQLLEQSLKITNSAIITFSGSSGVLVTGASGTQYFIKVSNMDNPMKGDPECSVAHYPSGSHICIVDKHGTGKQIGLDKVVARIYALKNDSVLAEHIHTIQGYVKQLK